MLDQATKDIYYGTLSKLSYVSLLFHRLRSSRYREAFVNVGCGAHYIPGMVNIDANPLRTKDIWLDVGLGLPFSSGSLKGIYASHVIEHFRIDALRRLLGEFRRCLQPGGTLRVVVPSLEYALQAYATNQAQALPDWPERYRSLGGRFHNLLLCANQHFLIFDLSFLREVLEDAGFRDVRREAPQQSGLFPAGLLEIEKRHEAAVYSLFVEARA